MIGFENSSAATGKMERTAVVCDSLDGETVLAALQEETRKNMGGGRGNVRKKRIARKKHLRN